MARQTYGIVLPPTLGSYVEYRQSRHLPTYEVHNISSPNLSLSNVAHRDQLEGGFGTIAELSFIIEHFTAHRAHKIGEVSES